MLSFFPRGVLDEILDLIESVSEGFPTHFWSRHGNRGSLVISQGILAKQRRLKRKKVNRSRGEKTI